MKIRITILFNIAKNLYRKGLKDDLPEIFRQIAENIINFSGYNLKENDFKSHPFQMLKNALVCLAETDCPKSCEDVILNISDNQLKERLALELFNVLYEMVDEVHIKTVPINIINQFYSLNTYISNINRNVIDFSVIGGNVSSNILRGVYDFKALFMSLFGYKNFGIFPTIDRIFMDLTYSDLQPFGYYIFPSNNAHDDIEIEIINGTIRQFFKNISEIKFPINIFNLDFIPFLGKPTVIISGNDEIVNGLKTAVLNKMKNSVDIFIDNDFFGNGKSSKMLEELFPKNKFRIMNLVLSYEFFNNYNEFKTFIEIINQNIF